MDDSTFTRLARETARIDFHELARFFAQGRVYAVRQGLDLPAVAAAFADDQAAAVRAWLDGGDVAPVDDATARRWFESRTAVWAVTVAPFVLVQAPASEQPTHG